MLHTIFILLAFLSIIVLAKSTNNNVNPSNSTNITPKSHYAFHLDKSWPLKSVSDLQIFGSSVDIDRDGNIILLHRGYKKEKPTVIKEQTVAVLDRKTGKILREWGSNKFIKPHGLTLSRSGDLFITDTVMHQIFKFEKNSSTHLWDDEAVLTLGEEYVPGFDNYHFCGPSDVVEIPESGEFFVADGYCHQRVVKFDKYGKYLLQFGSESSGENKPKMNFNVTHALALAYKSVPTKNESELQTILFVADRNNARIQCFDLNGTFIYEIGSENFGPETPMVLSMTATNVIPAHHQATTSNFSFGLMYVISGHLPQGKSKVYTFGLNENNAQLLSSFTINNNGNASATKENSKIETPHDIVVSKDGKEIYVVEASPELILRKFVWTEHKASQGHGKGNAKSSSSSHFTVFVTISILELLCFVVI